MSNDLDNTSRNRIRTDIHSNFFVEAGAGSGKTTVLVDRMVAMVEGGVDISKICAITFTKAAAGEFYSRFQNKLSERKTDPAQKALKNIDLCFMGTIDSFCGMVLSEHPAEAEIPSNATIVEDNELAALYRREYSRILKGEYGKDLQDKARVFSGAFYDPKTTFIKGLGILMDCRNARFNYDAPKSGGPDVVFKDDKERIKHILQYLLDHPEAVSIENKGQKAAWESLRNNKYQIFGDWADDISGVISSLKALRPLRIIKEYQRSMDELGPGWEKFFKGHSTRGSLAWYEINSDEDPFILKKLDTYRFAIAADFINSAVDKVAASLKKEGKLTFFDCLLYLRDMLKKDAAAGGKLIKHIYDRHSYFLIDEFQDTNPLQAEVFFYLTAKQPDPDWRKCVPHPGSLFIVGDPKQSIYRFRNADVASFIKVRGMFNPPVGEVLELSRNFRSTDKMCGWFNDTFTDLLPKDTDTQSKFSRIPVGEKPVYKAALNGAYYYTVNRYNKQQRLGYEDPKEVSDIIRKLMSNQALTVQGREDGAVPRPLQYKDFMVITPITTRMDLYAKEFVKAGIPFFIEGKIRLSECPALEALSRILDAAADPYDAKAVYSAGKLSASGITKQQMIDLAALAKSMSPAALCAYILDEYRLLAKRGAANAEYLYFAMELLRQAETDGTVTNIKEGAAYMHTLLSDEKSQERCIQLKADSNRVHIANLHKVKGLEAPVVILADPEGSDHEPEKRVDYSGDEPQSYLFEMPTGERFSEKIKSQDYADEKDKEAAVLRDEAVRLLYVAATRAEDLLIVSNSIDPTDDVPYDKNPWLPLLKHIDSDTDAILNKTALCDQIEKPVDDADALFAAAEANGALNDKTALNASYTIKKPSTVMLKGVTSSEDDHEDSAAEEIIKAKSANVSAGAGIGRVGIIPTLLGTMVHRIMEALVSSGNKADADALVQETLLEYQADPTVYKALLRGVIDKVCSGGYAQDNGVPADILAELLSAEEVHCELPFCYNEGIKDNEEADGNADTKVSVWHGVIDVVYKKDGVWHIIDYKTNVDPSDLDEHYRDQLSAYEKAFAAMTGQEAKAKVYHIG